MAAIKKFTELKFSDFFMFAAAMKDEEICKGVLERVLGIPIKKVKVHSEHSLLVNSDHRGIRMDVYADDEAGTKFNIEMQTTDKGNLPYRSRYYQGPMDMESLEPGDAFTDLPKVFIIFICKFDPFGQGLYRYSFDMQCRETALKLEDDVSRVFLNTKGRAAEGVSPDLIRFLKYVDTASLEDAEKDPLIRRIETRIDGLKHDRSMEVKYMQFEEILREERAEGRVEGRAEGRMEAVEKLMLLIRLMTEDGLAGEIPRLDSDAAYRTAMYEKYHIDLN